MPKIVWDGSGEKIFETGVDRGVLYPLNSAGAYPEGVAWNGLTAVTETPSGAESNPQYADNIKYLDIVSAEEFGGTIEAYTYPDEFAECDGSAAPLVGVSIGQQARKRFGFSYRTLVGNDIQGQDFGYKIHLWYGALAAPSEKAYTTINDSPEAITFSWEVTTSPVNVNNLRPTASLTIDTTKVPSAAVDAIEAILYGDDTTPARLPLPDEVISILEGASALTPVVPDAPTFDDEDEITIPTKTGVIYSIEGVDQLAGTVTITETTTVKARAAVGYSIASGVTKEWTFVYTP